jgi:hypothetical protein
LNALQCVFVHEKRSLHRAIVSPKPNRAPGRIIEAALIWKTKHDRSRSRSSRQVARIVTLSPHGIFLPVEGLADVG